MIGNLPDLGYGMGATWTIVYLWNLFVDWFNQF